MENVVSVSLGRRELQKKCEAILKFIVITSEVIKTCFHMEVQCEKFRVLFLQRVWGVTITMPFFFFFFLDCRVFCPHPDRKHEGHFYQEALFKVFFSGKYKNAFFECFLPDSAPPLPLSSPVVTEGDNKREVCQLKAFLNQK